MKSLKSLCLGVFCMLVGFGLDAQDIHFTQFDLSPITLNPANSGQFSGTARISGIYRSQTFNANVIGNNAISTSYTLNVDAPIVLGFSDEHWVGVGVAFYSDEAGSLNLGLTGFQGSLAYHMGLGGSKSKGRRGGRRSGTAQRVRGAVDKLKDKSRNFVPSKTYLSVGLTYGNRSRQFDISEVGGQNIFGSEFETGMPSPQRSALMGEGTSVTESGAGVMLTSELKDNLDVQFGVSALRLISDDYSLLNMGGSRAEEQALQLIFHANADYQINEKWSVRPQFVYRTFGRGEAVDGNIQALAGYRFEEDKDITLRAGLGYRLDDALLILLGADIGDLRVGLAFDNSMFSSLDSVEDSPFNAFEIGAQYIINIYKKPDADPVIFCPRL